MPTRRIPIQSLNGGVSRRESSKRLPQEVQDADNVVLTVERSAEKRPPLTHIKTGVEGDYLNIPNVLGSTPPEGTGITDPQAYYNTDNLYFHWIDVDGTNRYCVVINRAVEETNNMVRVFRIEPTEWIEEEFDRLSFDRGMKEYLLHHNLQTDSNDSLDDIMGSISYGAGAIFWNKKKKLDFLPDNSGKLKQLGSVDGFLEPHPGYIHSGDKINYKVADMFFVDENGNTANGGVGQDRLPGADEEDLEAVPYEASKDADGLYNKYISRVSSVNGGGYKNVSADIERRVNSVSLESFEVGHSLENFSDIPLPPPDDDTDSHAGWKAMAAAKHLYHRSEAGINNTEANGAEKADGSIEFDDEDLPTDGNVIVFENTKANPTLWKLKFDHSAAHSSSTLSQDSNNRYIVGLSGITDGVAGNGDTVAQRFAEVVDLLEPSLKIDAAINATLARKVDLEWTVYGKFTNSDIALEDSSGTTTTDAAITIVSFTGGDDAPDFGYLTSPFTDIRGTDSIYSYPNANDRGKGEIWYARDAYFTFTSGFYRTVSNSTGGQPYFQKVRAEDKNSVIDHRTFPVMIRKGTDGVWRVSYCPLIPKQNGSSINNPGPEAINNKETIKAMEFWKGRLWVATDTTIFASRVNDFFNYFIEDIQNLNDSDPIDITVNAGQFNRVQSLTSYQNFLFITTRSGTQFEIRGSATNSGAVSPTNIELRSTSFYSTASTANPVKMGNNIYFFDEEKVFLYAPSDAFGNEYSTALELSQHCRGYLPVNFQEVTPIPSYMSILMVDRDSKNDMYVYTTKTNGQQVVQNAFYRWRLDSTDSILSLQGYEDGFYMIVKRTNGITPKIYAYYGTFEPVTVQTPHLDRLVKIETNKISYDSTTNYTTIRLPYYDPNAREIVLAEDWSSDRRYTRHIADAISTEQFDGHYLTTLTVAGNLASERGGSGFEDRRVWVGRPYDMNIELSTLHARGRDNVAVPGVLNIKRLTTRHRNTGQYTVEVQRYNRATSSVRSEGFSFNDTTDLLGSTRIETEGELASKVLGYADSTSIFIKSNFPTPCNITNIEVIGNYRPGDTSIQK
jgi:hypothetical protein